MNDANREEVVRLARKGMAADQIAVRINENKFRINDNKLRDNECVSVEEVEEELAKLGDMSLTMVHVGSTAKTRVVRRAEILVFEIHQTWNGKDWVDSDASNITTEEDFAEARVGDELSMDRLTQLAEDLLEFAKANATRMEITNAKEG